MPGTSFLRLLVVCLALPLAGRAADGWERMKPGMTHAEVTAVLGEPLISSVARGFVIATYDRQAEVVILQGKVVAWTAPAGSAGTTSAEAWQFEQRARAAAPEAKVRRSRFRDQRL